MTTKEEKAELRESEDERIKKMLRDVISQWRNGNQAWCSGKLIDAALAWIEKQGEKDKLIKELGEYKVKYTKEVLEKHINNMSNKDDERLRNTTIAFLKDFAEQGYENAVECIDWLEKQGEQKSLDDIAKEVTKDKDAAISFLKSCGIMNENGELADEYK